MKLTCILAAALSVAGGALVAQIPGMRVFDESDGYTATTGYIVNQDSSGFIWIGSNKGAIRYDGHRFSVFDEHNGLKDKEITQALPSTGGFVLLTPLVNAIAYYHKGSIVNEDRDSLLRQVQHAHLNSLVSDRGNGNSWLGDTRNRDFLFRFRKGKLEKVALNIAQPFSLQHAYNHQLVLGIKDQGLKKYNTLTHTLSAFRVKEDTSLFQGLSMMGFSTHGQYIAGYNARQQRLAFYQRKNGDELSLINTREVNLEPKQLIVDQHGCLWATYKEAGIHYWGPISKINTQTRPIHLLPTTVVNHVFSDREHNLWFTTKRKGLYFIPVAQWQNYLRLRKLGFPSYLPTFVSGDRLGNVFFGYENSARLGVLRQGRYTDFPLSPHMSEGVSVLSTYKNLLCICSPEGHLSFVKQTKKSWQVTQQLSIPASLKDVRTGWDDSCLLFASNNGGFSVSLALPSTEKVSPLSFSHRCTAILPFAEAVLIGTPHGLWISGHSGSRFKKVAHAALRQANITDIEYVSDQIALVGTMADGLFLYQWKHLKAWPVEVEQDFKPGIIRQIFKEDSSTFWLATDRGVYRLTLKGRKVEEVVHYGFSDGFPSASVSSLWVERDTLYAVTSGGPCILPLQHQRKNAPYAVRILHASAGDSTTYLPRHIAHSYPVGNLSIGFSAFAFPEAGKASYRYTLKGYSAHWFNTQNPVANFSALPPGTYTFEVQALNPNGEGGEPVTQMGITIHPALWQTAWFRFLVLLFLLLLLGSSLYYSLWKHKKKAFAKLKQKRKLAELELEAIKAQINPHFIYNCLNSIQFFAYQNDYRSVGQYLDHFSALIRQTMELSQRMFAPLEDEVKYLSNYLKLEKMRFKERLTYTVNIPENISKLRLLPAMLLQPHVENALKHGVARHTEHGKVSIEILELSNHWLQVHITDNGPGINGKSPSGSRKKLGMRLSRGRVKAYNELFQLGIQLRISPLCKVPGAASQGTLVELLIPPIHYENINV